MASPLPGQPLTWKAKGLSDAEDATNAFPGAMALLSNLIPNPSTKHQFVPRPAAVQLTAFAGSGLTTPGVPTALLTVGNITYGMCPDTSGTFNGKDVPFAFNTTTNLFQTVAIPGGAASLPTSPAATGDWQPPCMVVVGSRIIVTHPGFAGGAGNYFGWLDFSGFTDNTHTGNTHTSTLIDSLSANVLLAGWQVGMTITGAGIPANTTISTIASNGLSLTLSQATNAGANGVPLTVAGGTATSPLWSSGNTNGNALASVPTWAAQFNGRAYFAVGSGMTFSDSGSPCQVTNATQAISFRNGLTVTAIGGIGLFSSTVGGIVQSLMAFQGDVQVWQLQGDTAFTGGLTINALLSGIGTLAPNTIEQTPYGLAFIAPDGMRIIDPQAKFTDPIGIDGDGIVVPFLNALTPSRMNAAFNQGIYRVTVKNGLDPNQATQEYWFDMARKIWTGPHTFPFAMIANLQGTTNSFIGAATGIAGKLWQSDPLPISTSTYTENGAAMIYEWETCLLPDNQQMSENAVIESAIGLKLPPGVSVTVVAFDEEANTLGQVMISAAAGTATLWDVAQWDAALWDGAASTYRQYPIAWTQPLVFKQMQVQVNGTSSAGIAVGNLSLRYDELDYQMQNAGLRV